MENCCSPTPLQAADPSPSSLEPAGPSLFDHIAHIVRVRAEKKVLGVYTSWIVAGMEHAKSFINSTEINQPRESVGMTRLTAKQKSAVSLLVFARLPSPAIIRARLVHLIPEAVEFMRREVYFAISVCHSNNMICVRGCSSFIRGAASLIITHLTGKAIH